MRRAVLVLLTVLLTVACGDDGGEDVDVGSDADIEDAGGTEKPVDDVVAEDPAPPEHSPEGDDEGSDMGAGSGETDDFAEALALFQSFESLCAQHAEDTGNPPVESFHFSDAQVTEEVEPRLFRVIDGAGNELLIDLVDEVVFAAGGDDQPLPREYSFGCPEDVFLGTLDEGE